MRLYIPKSLDITLGEDDHSQNFSAWSSNSEEDVLNMWGMGGNVHARNSPSPVEMGSICDRLDGLGFRAGAVVAKWSDPHHKKLDPLYWGIIMNLMRYWPAHHNFQYKPVKVRWVETGKEDYWSESELIIMNPVRDRHLLNAYLLNETKRRIYV